MDEIHKLNDELISSLDSDLHRLYAQNDKKVQKGAAPLLKKIYLEDQNATQRQRMAKAEKDDNKEALIFAVVWLMLRANERAIDKINNMSAKLYIMNYDHMIDEIERIAGQELHIKRFGAIDKAEKLIERTRGYYDKRAYRRLVDEKRLTMDVTRRLDKSIKNGDSAAEMMKSLRHVVWQSKNSSRLTADTDGTRIINSARLKIFKEAEQIGIKMQKIWSATMDERVRDTHFHMNGETVDVDRPFSNGGMFPADHALPPEERINCRCWILPKILDNSEKSGIMNVGGGKMGVSIHIDKFTPCLEDARTGKLVATAYDKATREELKDLKKQGWLFDWAVKELDSSEIYKLTLSGDSKIQGLISIKDTTKDSAVHVILAESAPHNKGSDKMFDGVGGHLFAIAAKKSIEKGYNGYLFMDAKNEELVEHYIRTLSAKFLGIAHPYRMFIDEYAAHKLLKKYTLED